MKTLFTILLAFGMLTSTAVMADTDKINHALTKSTAKEMGVSKQVMAQIDELNQERAREIRIASIVYKNHPIMLEAKINAANEKYKNKLQELIPAEQFQAYMSKQ